MMNLQDKKVLFDIKIKGGVVINVFLTYIDIKNICRLNNINLNGDIDIIKDWDILIYQILNISDYFPARSLVNLDMTMYERKTIGSITIKQ